MKNSESDDVRHIRIQGIPAVDTAKSHKNCIYRYTANSAVRKTLPGLHRRLNKCIRRKSQEKTQIPSSSEERLDWNYYDFVRNNPVAKWTAPTSILYGEHDALTDRTTAESFSEKFGCSLTVAENCEHWFHTPEQLKVLDGWLDNVL
jgi:pimeloyl-ACP methyl ester carboxylesterase